MTWHKIGQSKNYHISLSYTPGHGVSNDTKHSVVYSSHFGMVGPRIWCIISERAIFVGITSGRPSRQAAESYRVDLQPNELIQIARFHAQMVEFAQMYLNQFQNAVISRSICKKMCIFFMKQVISPGCPNGSVWNWQLEWKSFPVTMVTMSLWKKHDAEILF